MLEYMSPSALVLLVDGYDVVLQEPATALVARYRKLLREAGLEEVVVKEFDFPGRCVYIAFTRERSRQMRAVKIRG